MSFITARLYLPFYILRAFSEILFFCINFSTLSIKLQYNLSYGLFQKSHRLFRSPKLLLNYQIMPECFSEKKLKTVKHQVCPYLLQ